MPADPGRPAALDRIEMTMLPLFTTALALGAGYAWFQLLERAAITTALALELCASWWTLYHLNRRGSQWTPYR